MRGRWSVREDFRSGLAGACVGQDTRVCRTRHKELGRICKRRRETVKATALRVKSAALRMMAVKATALGVKSAALRVKLAAVAPSEAGGVKFG